MEFSSVNSLRRCLLRGIGVTICPEVAVKEELLNGRLAKLRWEAKDMDTPVIMIWHTEKWCSPLLKHFMHLSKKILCDEH